MKQLKLSIILFLCLNALLCKLYSQTQLQINEIWDKLVTLDDREKNFRLPSFLETSSKIVFCDCETLFPNWIYEDIPETEYFFLSGILPYTNQNSLLIWIISSETENKSWSFTKELDFLGLPNDTDLSVNFENNKAMSILINGKKYVEIPDISIKVMFSKLNDCKVDSEKVEISMQIWENLHKLLENKMLFDNKFTDFEQLATIISNDKKVKISTWNIVLNSGEQIFYGILVINTASNFVVYKLHDQRESIKNNLQQILTPDKWYGCVYYDIITNKYKNDTYYTLIGFNGNNAFTQIKIVDVLTFSESGNHEPKFGVSIFNEEYKNNRRLIFEYRKNATMMLRFDPKMNMIVMDNLSPSEPFYRNDYRYYGPDFSHNGLKFEKGKWIFYSDIDLRNPYTSPIPQDNNKRKNRLRSLELENDD